jgi:hypothetical protein
MKVVLGVVALAGFLAAAYAFGPGAAETAAPLVGEGLQVASFGCC